MVPRPAASYQKMQILVPHPQPTDLETLRLQACDAKSCRDFLQTQGYGHLPRAFLRQKSHLPSSYIFFFLTVHEKHVLRKEFLFRLDPGSVSEGVT